MNVSLGHGEIASDSATAFTVVAAGPGGQRWGRRGAPWGDRSRVRPGG